MKEYHDGDIAEAIDVKRDFIFDSRNDFLKYSAYYSKDGQFVATIYDDCDFTTIERA